MSPKCFNCGHDIITICKDDVLSVVGEDGAKVSAVMAIPRGTLSERSKLVLSMLHARELILTTERTLHVPGTL